MGVTPAGALSLPVKVSSPSISVSPWIGTRICFSVSPKPNTSSPLVGVKSAPSVAGTLAVRASLKNGASFAQPMPLLRLELEDRFGGTVARRDFQPAEYLKDPAQATRLLHAGASTEAELEIVGATAEAVGYRLDVCLRDESGMVLCAEPDDRSPPSDRAPQ